MVESSELDLAARLRVLEKDVLRAKVAVNYFATMDVAYDLSKLLDNESRLKLV